MVDLWTHAQNARNLGGVVKSGVFDQDQFVDGISDLSWELQKYPILSSRILETLSQTRCDGTSLSDLASH